MSKKKLSSLLFWCFFVGLFCLCSINQKKPTISLTNVKRIKKDTCKVFKDEEVLLWTDGTWDTLPYKLD